ncbi:uncharacterized protein LOC134824940 isoform X2 [Bolinopsis microptera]|uniref:uncharacterized protein LOC134824940 isoform X2 n=1 Tax=Bolinopsis microptera TaxID=2820187 RepID=UPI00307A6E51
MLSALPFVTLILVVFSSTSQEKCLEEQHQKHGLEWGPALQVFARRKAESMLDDKVRRNRRSLEILSEKDRLGFYEGVPVYLESVTRPNLGVHHHMCSLYMDHVEEYTLGNYKESYGVNKVGCDIAENRHTIAAVCVYKNQPKSTS